MPIKKLGNGYYIFGTRKIYAKILNGKLVIRVGGGYMVIEEFISTYAEQELNKMNKLNERTDDEDTGDVDSLDLTPASRGGSRKIIYDNNMLQVVQLVGRELTPEVQGQTCHLRRHSLQLLIMGSVEHTETRS